jgi:hypothetical protein
VVAKAALEGAARVVVLHPVRVEGLDLAAVPGDDELDEDLALRGEE